MISRHWKGIAKAVEADNYIQHLKTDTLPKLNGIKGFLNASILKRKLNEGVEFLIITDWESLEAVKEFAGEKIDSAVVPENVQNMMVDYDKTVKHFEVEYVSSVRK